MTINVTEDEFDAIRFARILLSTNIEAADDDFAHDASVHDYHLLRLIAKICRARERDHEIKALRQTAKEMFPDRDPKFRERLVRKSLAFLKATHSTQI